MKLIYFAHSYREQDATLVRYFGELVRSEGFIPVLDPPSESVNAARLQRHIKDSDGMVVVLTHRDGGVSPHILVEATLCLQARKPLLVFVEDVLSVHQIPERVLRCRFSRKWFFRQVREHRQAMRLFGSYIGEEPPPRYQPNTACRSCLVIGFSALAASAQDAVVERVTSHGYEVVLDELSDSVLDQSVQLSEQLACADIAVEVVDSMRPADHYLRGALRAAFVPRISLTTRSDYPFEPVIPVEYQPRSVDRASADNIKDVLSSQFTFYEQAFIELETPQEVTKYVDLLLKATSLHGNYGPGTRSLFVQELNVGDQYKVGQAGAVGPQSHAHDMNFQQVWNEAASTIDLQALASELARLRPQLKAVANTPEQDVAIGEIAMAEVAAKQKDGPKALAHLAKAGRWALEVSEKIGVAIAAGAIKTAMGI